MTNIILIHGINNQKNSKSIIEDTWINALRNGVSEAGGELPEQTTFQAAFYGKLLKVETDNWNKGVGSSTAISSESSSEEYFDDEVYDLYREYQSAFGISDDKLIEYTKSTECSDSIQVEGAGIHKGWLKAITRALEDIVPTKGKFLARIFLKQAAAYLHKPMLKEEIDAIVYEQVFENIDPKQNNIVISHSLGTIVGYSILRALGPEVSVKLFLTAGSPLGIEIVKKKLGPPLVKPSGVKKWVNISDPQDFVALHKTLNIKTFGTSNITNISNLDNGYDDPHDILKYLAHAKVGKQILDSL